MEILGYIALIGVGIILGLMGGGGSMFAVPILVYLFSMDVVIATAYSLFMVGMTSVVGTILKQKERLVDVRSGLVFGIPSVAVAFSVRKWVVPGIPEFMIQTENFQLTKREFLLCLFGLLVIVSSLLMITRRKILPDEKQKPQIVRMIFLGLIIGWITGLVGIGGGFLILPVMVVFAKLPFKSAAGTALFIIALNSLFGFMGDLSNYTIDWIFLISITGLAIMGMLIGNLSNKVIPARSLQKSFGWITLTVGVCVLAKEL